MIKPLKILQLGKAYPLKGGVENVMFQMMATLNESENFKCDALCASISKKQKLDLMYGGKIIATPTLFKKYATYISPAMLWKLFQIKKNYDIIHIHHPDPMAALALFFSGFKKKRILHWHSDILRQKKLLIFYKPLQNWLLKKVDTIICTTPLYPKHSKYLKKYQHKIKILPISIPKMPPPDISQVTKIKSKNAKIIFSLGRLVSYKGFEYLIKSAMYLPEDYTIFIGGQGVLKESLQKIISENNLSQKVFLLGKLTDAVMKNYYHACDIFCLPSIEKTEAFGIVLLQAMSCGKPIVATEIKGSGVPWVNKNKETGINVPTKNPQSIAAAIQKIIENKEIYHLYSQNAQKRFEMVFRKENNKNELLKIYTKTLTNS